VRTPSRSKEEDQLIGLYQDFISSLQRGCKANEDSPQHLLYIKEERSLLKSLKLRQT